MNYLFLANTPLFRGIQPSEIEQLLTCLNSRKKQYKKNEIIFCAGSPVHEIGLVLSGSVNIVVNFYWGTSHIFGHIEKGAIFAENYAAIPGKELLCDVLATEPTEILFLNLNQLLTVCQKTCHFHQKLVHNLVFISAQKSLNLSSRMMHIAPKSIRERLLSYLSEQAMINGNTHFTIPFDRQQLADYLGVNRSAMSNELSKMQKDGLIHFKKNDFILNSSSPQ
jgi:hypothetical protein